MDAGELVKKFMEADLQLTEDAFDNIRQRQDAEVVADHVLEVLKKMQSRPSMVTADMISKILEGEPSSVQEVVPLRLEKAAPSLPEKRLPELAHKKFTPFAAEHESRIRVIKDVTGRSYGEGSIKDFVRLFNDRFDKLSRILHRRTELSGAASIGSLRSAADGEQVKVIGMVASKRRSKNGHLMLELEDKTGTVTAFVFKNSDLFQKADNAVTDEVVGVIGSVRSGDRSPRIFTREIIWPDLPLDHERKAPAEPTCVVQISDLHIGSDKFLEELFMRFIKWLRGEVGDQKQRELAGRVKYITIAGDVVDGIGVYPEQLGELLIQDIYKQYDAAAKLLAEIPDYITLVVVPGNHDAVRPSEPQPAIPKDLAEGIYNLNCRMLGNPALVSIEGINFQLYHGRSFDDLITAVPGLSRKKPSSMMVKLLQKRHMAPIYGGRAAISPEREDLLVMDEVPDVFHCGHVHVYGCEQYRNVWAVNSGTFQEKTQYMQKMGVEPTPGLVPILDLQKNNLLTLDLWGEQLLG
ncbi:MAG: DNA-directed DNA polymerase II small subunit [Candidatus Hadarchaeota archaeon]